MIAKTEPLEHINLQGGWPTPRLHPTEALALASQKVFQHPDIKSNLRYGPERGSSDLRVNIGKWLTDAYALSTGAVPEERILITNGASNGLATLLQKFSDPNYTRGVWMVEPTYFLACPIFRDAGLGGKLRGVAEVEDGVDVEMLRTLLEECDEKSYHEITSPKKVQKIGYPKMFRHIIYAVPTFSNPSGKTMSLKNRQALVQLARKHDALVICDDVYDMLRWPAAESSETKISSCPPRMADIDRSTEGSLPFGNCVSNGSFSKIVAPGVRVGWIEGDPLLITAMGTVGASVSGGCQSHMSSMIINELLASGALQSHLDEVVTPTLQSRYYGMTKAIKRYLEPLGALIVSTGDYESQGIAGGFFLYVSFVGTGLSGDDIARTVLEDKNVRIAPGTIFAVPDDPLSKTRMANAWGEGARLCWAWNEEDELVEAIMRLGQTIKELQGDN